MIGKPEWFERRKYGGWGLVPKTWQGWIYLAVMVAIVFAIQMVPIFDSNTRLLVTLIWAAILVIDTVDMMIKLKRDEREHKIESIAERNAAWAMVAVLAIGIAYQAATSAVTKSIQVDLFLVAALLVGLLAKAISNIILERREL
ncbi:MAG: hypothetical protein WCW44_06040 [archaeon]|jgi:hypothetical protein